MIEGCCIADCSECLRCDLNSVSPWCAVLITSRTLVCPLPLGFCLDGCCSFRLGYAQDTLKQGMPFFSPRRPVTVLDILRSNETLAFLLDGGVTTSQTACRNWMMLLAPEGVSFVYGSSHMEVQQSSPQTLYLSRTPACLPISSRNDAGLERAVPSSRKDGRR